MKSLTEHLWFDVSGRRAFINITPKVQELVRKSGVKEGLCLVNAMHITASVFINDDESGLHRDYEKWLEKLAPHEPTSQYDHNRTGEDNADAHMKRQIMGREVVSGNHSRQPRFRAMGTDFLRRVRRRTPQTRSRENHWRVRRRNSKLTTAFRLSLINQPSPKSCQFFSKADLRRLRYRAAIGIRLLNKTAQFEPPYVGCYTELLRVWFWQ